MSINLTKEIIPLLISLLLMIISTGVAMFSNNILDSQHYICFLLILTSIFFYFKNKKIYVYVFCFTLIAGLIKLLDLFYLNIQLGFGIVSFNPIFLVLLIAFLTLNKELLNTLFPKKRIIENDLARNNKEKENLIKNYELKFQSKSESELKNILVEKSGYVNEAKIAAKNILQNK